MIQAIKTEYASLRTRLLAIAPEHAPRLRLIAMTESDTEFSAALQDVIDEAMKELSADSKPPPIAE